MVNVYVLPSSETVMLSAPAEATWFFSFSARSGTNTLELISISLRKASTWGSPESISFPRLSVSVAFGSAPGYRPARRSRAENGRVRPALGFSLRPPLFRMEPVASRSARRHGRAAYREDRFARCRIGRGTVSPGCMRVKPSAPVEHAYDPALAPSDP